jgi:hypothetical protein
MASGTDGNIISYDASGNPVAVATGTDGQVLTSAGAGAPPAFEDAAAGGGITESDTWRLTTGFTGDATPIASNLERDDRTDNGFTLLGTGMTQSSGVFTFPSTGFWLVTFVAFSLASAQADGEIDSQIQVTENNSAYATAVVAQGNVYVAGGRTSIQGQCVVDVSDTTNVKVRFRITNEASTNTIHGDTNTNYTYMQFTRLGDT